MTLYSWLEWLHILSAIVLFGSAIAIAWFKWSGDRTGDVHAIHTINQQVRAAGWIFTAPTLILQPVTGIILAVQSNRSLAEDWIAGSLVLYAVAAGCWTYGVRMQSRMLALSAATAVEEGRPLPAQYATVARWWRGLHIAMLASFLAILWIMVFKPD